MVARDRDAGFRYWAFISYSHQDEAWARWLHRALERYRIPPRLVGMPIDAGVVPTRLSPIFRDRDELPTAADLGHTIHEALRQSYCLVVICSAASARSRWVDEEVRTFQALGRGDRIFCLAIEDLHPVGAASCFPPALQAFDAEGQPNREPVAADARPQADGRYRAKLKLIGGILGVGFDRLVRREQQRRLRRALVVASAAVLAVVVLAGISAMALAQRRDAEAQRAHAERLVEFMLGDLRKKLQPDGRLSILDAVGTEALAYYSAQATATLDADALARRARSLHLIGEVQDERGRLDAALDVFQRAAESTEELLAREPQSAQRIFDHAQSVYWIGHIAFQRGDYDGAEQAFGRYKALADQLIAKDGDKPEWLSEVEYAASNLGVVLLRRRQPAAAQRLFEEALAVDQRLVAAAPDDPERQMSLAQTQAWLSDCFTAQGRIADSVREREAEIAVYENLIATTPGHRDALRAMALAERALAELSTLVGDSAMAQMQLGRAAEIVKALIAEEPDNMSTALASSVVYGDLGESMLSGGDSTAAEDAATRAKTLAVALVARDPTVVDWQFQLARVLLLEARLLAKRNKHFDALRLAQSIEQKLDAVQSTSSPTFAVNLLRAKVLVFCAETNEHLAQPTAAAEDRKRAESLIKNESNGADPRMLVLATGASRSSSGF